MTAIETARQGLAAAQAREAEILKEQPSRERGARLRRIRTRIKTWQRMLNLAKSQEETRKTLEKE